MSSSQKPTVGRIVHVPMPRSANNGSPVAPAIITQVNEEEETINVRILPDAPPSPHDYRRDLAHADELDDDPTTQESLYFWTWPPRS
ncbi:hypothetical protein ACQEV9_18345 [Streptomyces chartreusis]|uniref:hypothetical protein n=1 Tax=Streptomyces chartreusis TaxID=1969 RepID=UPI003D91AAA6